jgi:hypothetical protein
MRPTFRLRAKEAAKANAKAAFAVVGNNPSKGVTWDMPSGKTTGSSVSITRTSSTMHIIYWAVYDDHLVAAAGFLTVAFLL